MSRNHVSSVILDEFAGLPDVLKKQGIVQAGTFAMATGPGCCLMLRVQEDGSLADASGAVVDLAGFYEVVAFCPDWQITAIRDGVGARLEVLAFGAEGSEEDILHQDYLVWGKVMKNTAEGWCEIGSPRTGKIDFPAPAGVKQADLLALTAMEFVETLEHGNRAVTRQRLTGIKIYQGSGESS